MTASGTDDPVPRTGEEPAPGTLRWAVRLLLVEAVGLGVLTAYLSYQDSTASAEGLASGIGLTVFAAAGAAAVLALGRAVRRRSAAARGPAIVVQLMLLALAYYMGQAHLYALAIPLALLGLAVCALLLAPTSTRAFGLQ